MKKESITKIFKHDFDDHVRYIQRVKIAVTGKEEEAKQSGIRLLKDYTDPQEEQEDEVQTLASLIIILNCEHRMMRMRALDQERRGRLLW